MGLALAPGILGLDDLRGLAHGVSHGDRNCGMGCLLGNDLGNGLHDGNAHGELLMVEVVKQRESEGPGGP